MLCQLSISKVWTGIVLRDCQDTTVQYNTIDWTAGDGIYITGSSSAKGCTNVTVHENSLSRIGDTGIDISSSYGATSSLLKIVQNNFTECNVLTPSLEQNGIGITLSRCQNVDVKGNIISLPKGGILVGKSVSDAEVEDNTILDYSRYGICDRQQISWR
jgi:parallel beta-helix repeat protein